MTLSDINLYRITHIENIPHILKYGVTHRKSANSNPDFVTIGDKSLIGFRDTKTITVNGVTITLGDYIPFYFGVRMPMLYTIQHGYNFTCATSPDKIVYVVISLSKIVADDSLEFLFTDGHAVDSITSFYTKTDIDKLPEIIDWNAVKARKWSGEGLSPDIRRRKQAEVLVDGDIPAKYIIGYVCYNETAKQQLIGYGIDENIVKIFPKAYY